MIFALAKIMEVFDYSVGARPISSTHRLVVTVGRPVNKYQSPRPLYHTSSGIMYAWDIQKPESAIQIQTKCAID